MTPCDLWLWLWYWLIVHDANCDCEGDILNSMLRSFDYDPDEEEGFHVKDLDPFMKLLCALIFAISSSVNSNKHHDSRVQYFWKMMKLLLVRCAVHNVLLSLPWALWRPVTSDCDCDIDWLRLMLTVTVRVTFSTQCWGLLIMTPMRRKVSMWRTWTHSWNCCALWFLQFRQVSCVVCCASCIMGREWCGSRNWLYAPHAKLSIYRNFAAWPDDNDGDKQTSC